MYELWWRYRAKSKWQNKLFTHYIKRDQPKKRGPRQHKKNLNKAEKRQRKNTRYKGQG